MPSSASQPDETWPSLPYDIVRQAEAPDETLLEFLQSMYAAAADLAQWDRNTLERRG